MNLPRALLVLVLVVVPVVMWSTGMSLPPVVASHFAQGGQANGFMPRDTYLLLMIAFATLLPLLVAATNGLLPRQMPKRMVRDPAYWLDPARREDTLRFLNALACAIAILISLFLLGVHLLVLRANAARPPQLPMPEFFVLLGVFVALLAVWMVALHRRFRAP